MIKEYITTLAGAVALSTIAELILPGGDFKKYAKLVTGMIVICTMISPFTKDIDFSAESFSIENMQLDVEKAQAQMQAKIIEKHRENIENGIKEKAGEGSKVIADIDNDGNIVHVTIILKEDAPYLDNYLKNELGLNDEKIEVQYENF